MELRNIGVGILMSAMHLLSLKTSLVFKMLLRRLLLRLLGSRYTSKGGDQIEATPTEVERASSTGLSSMSIHALIFWQFLSQFTEKFQKHLKSSFKRPAEEMNREMFKLKDSKFNLEKQLQAWRKKSCVG